MNFAAIVLCRLDSKRFPQKVLHDISAKPLIWYPIVKCRQIKNVKIIIATTERKVDNPIVDWAQKNDLTVFRGATFNVAKRIVDCLNHNNIDYFFRINADSPFLEISLLEQAYKLISKSKYHFVTNIFPRSYPYGVSVEFFDANVFNDGYKKMKGLEQEEHPTMFFYQNADSYCYYNIYNRDEKLDHYRLAIDTPEDFKRLSSVIEILHKKNWIKSSYRDAIEILEGI